MLKRFVMHANLVVDCYMVGHWLSSVKIVLWSIFSIPGSFHLKSRHLQQHFPMWHWLVGYWPLRLHITDNSLLVILVCLKMSCCVSVPCQCCILCELRCDRLSYNCRNLKWPPKPRHPGMAVSRKYHIPKLPKCVDGRCIGFAIDVEDKIRRITFYWYHY